MDTSRDILPDDVKPKHYSFALSNLYLQAPWTYRGQVDIDLEVRRATQVVVLNSHELEIDHAQTMVQQGSDSDPTIHRSTSIFHDAESQRCFIHFDVELEPTAHKVLLSLCFEGYMNDYMAGFYRSEYMAPNGELMHMLSTQFEPSEARRAFPCFDEPALKATFDMEIEVPAGMIALSNMPVKVSRPPSGQDERRETITFERNRRMSTYLLSWAIGQFEFVEQTLTRKHGSAPLPIRVYTTERLCQHAKRGLLPHVAARG